MGGGGGVGGDFEKYLKAKANHNQRNHNGHCAYSAICFWTKYSFWKPTETPIFLAIKF